MRLSIVGVPKDLTIHIRFVLSVFGSSISCISVVGFSCRHRRVSVRVFTELSPSSRFFVLLSWLILYMSIISPLSCELKYGKMLSGMAFGPEAGFLVGAVSAFASNFFYGQGAYTPWQMFAYGAGGMLAGFLFAKGRLPKNRWVMAAFGFLTCVCFVGPLLDTCTIFLTLPRLTAKTVWPIFLSGLPVNVSQGLCTALTMVLFGNPLLEKLDRVKVLYGMEEDDGL